MSDTQHSHSQGHDHGHDDWFTHDPAEVAPQGEHASHISSKALGVTFLVTVFGILFVVLFLSLFFSVYKTDAREMIREGTDTAEPYMRYRAASKERLAASGWVDREAGTVHMPIGLAMDEVVESYATETRADLPAWRGVIEADAEATEVASHDE